MACKLVIGKSAVHVPFISAKRVLQSTICEGHWMLLLNQTNCEYCRPLLKLQISFPLLQPNISSELSGFVPISSFFLILSFSVATTAPMRGGGRGMRGVPRGRGNPRMNDMFRSRKQNTSRPPSMHVDDFMAMEHAKTQDSPPPMRRAGPKVYSTNFSFDNMAVVLAYKVGQTCNEAHLLINSDQGERTVWWCALVFAFDYKNKVTFNKVICSASHVLRFVLCDFSGSSTR